VVNKNISLFEPKVRDSKHFLKMRDITSFRVVRMPKAGNC